MKTAFHAWLVELGKFKPYAAILGIFLCGALVTYGLSSWYFTYRLDAQAALYDAQINVLGESLDKNARITLTRLDSISERIEFIVAELSRASKAAGQASDTAKEASETAKEAAQAVKEAAP